MKIKIRLDVEQEDLPVRGNALASGDPAEDKRVEDEILRRLRRGEVWAWCWVRVTARVEIEGEVFLGTASLGGCSYENEEDFKATSGYYEDLKKEAIEDLKTSMSAAVKRAGPAQHGLTLLRLGESGLIEMEEES